MAGLFNRARMATSSTGTDSFALGLAAYGHQTLAQAGVTNGTVLRYAAETDDKREWEVGQGTYSSSGPTLTRTTVYSSSDGGTKVSFSSPPQVWVDYTAAQDTVASVKDYGAIGDDSTTNTTAIQAAFDSGNAWIYVPDGIFRSAGLTIPSTVKRIYGPGTLKATGSITNWFLETESGVSDFTIECVIDVSPTTYSAVSALAFIGATNSKVSGVYFKNSGQRAVLFRSACTNCGVENCRIEGFAQFAIAQLTSGGASSGTFIHNNKITNTASCTSHIITLVGGTGDDVAGNEIDGNGNPHFGINIDDGINPHVHGNEIWDTTKEAIHFASTVKGRIGENRCDWIGVSSTDFGISVADDGTSGNDPTDSQIIGNYVRRPGKTGIASAGGAAGIMVGNIVIDPNQLAGSNPTATHSNGFEIYGTTAQNWHVASNLAISNDGNMTYGYSELPTEAGADNNTFQANRSIGHATGEYNLSGASSTWNHFTISPDEAYDATGWNGDLTPPTKNAVRDKIEGLSSVYQPLDAGLTDIAGLAVTDSNVIVGNGTNWVAESGATARTSLGLGTGDSPQFTAINLGHATNTTLGQGSAAGIIAVESVDQARTVDIQEFTSSGTWTKPTGAKWVEAWAVGSGGGGGGGARTTSGNASSGGGGGGGAARLRTIIAASDLGSTVSVTVGAGGASGAGATSDGTAGTDGGGGNHSAFGTVITAYGGGGGAGGEPANTSGGGGGAGVTGAGGNATSTTGGAAGLLGGAAGGSGVTGSLNSLDQGGGGGAGGANGAAGGGNTSAASTVSGATGGGGGGGISVAPAAFDGGRSSHSCMAYGAATASAASPGTTGANGNTGLGKAGSGATGGASNTAGVGFAGGTGGNYGGGGGGGGSAIGGDGGAGGVGGPGYVRVITYF